MQFSGSSPESSRGCWPTNQEPRSLQTREAELSPAVIPSYLVLVSSIRKNVEKLCMYSYLGDSCKPESVLEPESHWQLKATSCCQGCWVSALPGGRWWFWYWVCQRTSAPNLFPTLYIGGNNWVSIVLYFPSIKVYVQVNLDTAIIGYKRKGRTLDIYWPLSLCSIVSSIFSSTFPCEGLSTLDLVLSRLHFMWMPVLLTNLIKTISSNSLGLISSFLISLKEKRTKLQFSVL